MAWTGNRVTELVADFSEEYTAMRCVGSSADLVS